ncbi:MAG TPA: methyltransferase domain-containing protein [Bryobacteraceae bacterium]|nr:methyltransferase domain-containing protein [Bryobacteraceae bacterium]
MSVTAAFNSLALAYDQKWSHSVVGRLQRDAVWSVVSHLFPADSHVLDLGCGTGEDAVRLARAGVRVHAIDVSPGMIEVARSKIEQCGVSRLVRTEVLAIESLGKLRADQPFDGALANFGSFNCVEDWRGAAAALVDLVRPGGKLALCVVGRVCLWESVWYLIHGAPKKAFRRTRGSATATFSPNTSFRVTYPSVQEMDAAFGEAFRRVHWRGIGLCVPPSYVRVGPRLGAALAACDRWLAGFPPLRALSDHRLFVYVRS